MPPQQMPLIVLETSLHTLTLTEIAHTTDQSNTAIRLLLKRMADSSEIAHSTRGLHIAHRHRLASNSPVNTETPATTETFDTIANTRTPTTSATFETFDTTATSPNPLS